MYCEVKTKGLDVWRAAGRIFKNYWDMTKKEFVSIVTDNGEYAFGEPYTLHPYDDRDYDLFGMLANVRNGTWSEPVIPISLPKGLPKDVSKFVNEKANEWNLDGHSHSFLTLEELEKYEWKKKVKMERYVTKEQKKEYDEKGIKPDSYALYISDGVLLEWDAEIYPKYFVEEVIPQLQALKKFGEVRIVFWFDN